jgi:hypothetical protein
MEPLQMNEQRLAPPYDPLVHQQEVAFTKLVDGLTADGGPDAPPVSHQRLLDLVVQHWRNGQLPGPQAGNLSLELVLLPTMRKSDQKPVVLLQLGSLSVVITPQEALTYASLFHRAAEIAVTDTYLHQCFRERMGEAGDVLSREVMTELNEFRRLHYGVHWRQIPDITG